MIPSVVLEGRLMLSDENTYFEQIFPNSGNQKAPGRNNERENPDDAGLCLGIQALLTLA
ncbi:MAG: hypothetical protein H6Q52_2326 [Deltaproteobacteria bacterium]|nr:hypothetical protein [Deltaproteobacteria bacterium]